MERPVITPLPPVAEVALPWDELVADPVAALAGARAEHGDTFVVDGSHTCPAQPFSLSVITRTVDRLTAGYGWNAGFTAARQPPSRRASARLPPCASTPPTTSASTTGNPAAGRWPR